MGEEIERTGVGDVVDPPEHAAHRGLAAKALELAADGSETDRLSAGL